MFLWTIPLLLFSSVPTCTTLTWLCFRISRLLLVLFFGNFWNFHCFHFLQCQHSIIYVTFISQGYCFWLMFMLHMFVILSCLVSSILCSLIFLCYNHGNKSSLNNKKNIYIMWSSGKVHCQLAVIVGLI